jgi:GTP-binding protein EngB required for normal cell division
MTMTGRLREALRRDDQRVDADALANRVAALGRFADAAGPHVPDATLGPARAVVQRAGMRLELSRDHTVIALTGATGSGKSSIFNALAGFELSAVGVRRPTTGEAHACVWQAAGADGLLDWLGIDRANRFVRESALDADDQAALRGLVLLDLPDFDSVQADHRAEVDRLLRLVDLVVWVTDPQKYADQVIHGEYLRVFHGYARNMVVVLNQADRLSETDVVKCIADLRSLLNRDGLSDVSLFATSATAARPGLDELRGTLERTVADRVAALGRLSADVDGAVDSLSPLVGPPVDADAVDRGPRRDLGRALAVSAGVPAVTEAVGRAYRFRAGKSMGWPLTRWVRHLRADPLTRLRLGRANPSGSSATSIPGPTAGDRSTASLAVRAVGEHAAEGLPTVWRDAASSAARSRAGDLPDALDRAVARTDLGVDRKPWWWRVVNALQWLATVAAFAGAVWLLVRVGFIALGLPPQDAVHIGGVPLATVILVGGVVAGILLALLVKPLIAAGAKRARSRAAGRLRTSIAEISDDLVLEPVRKVLADYGTARSALADASR